MFASIWSYLTFSCFLDYFIELSLEFNTALWINSVEKALPSPFFWMRTRCVPVSFFKKYGKYGLLFAFSFPFMLISRIYLPNTIVIILFLPLHSFNDATTGFLPELLLIIAGNSSVSLVEENLQSFCTRYAKYS